jgi:hypothetical protein
MTCIYSGIYIPGKGIKFKWLRRVYEMSPVPPTKKPPILLGGSSENLNFIAFLGRIRDSFRIRDFDFWFSFGLDKSKIRAFGCG